MLSATLLEILACPACKGKLVLTPNEEGLACHACELLFPVRDGIPVLLVDEAVKMTRSAGEAHNS
jgi:uncharacterized protein YbaR (Trm112 family)